LATYGEQIVQFERPPPQCTRRLQSRKQRFRRDFWGLFAQLGSGDGTIYGGEETIKGFTQTPEAFDTKKM
jgi:hypothetical protein